MQENTMERIEENTNEKMGPRSCFIMALLVFILPKAVIVQHKPYKIPLAFFTEAEKKNPDAHIELLSPPKVNK